MPFDTVSAENSPNYITSGTGTLAPTATVWDEANFEKF